MTIDAHWYDLDRCRRVELKVHYWLTEDSLEVGSIQPISISFYSRETMAIDRQVNIQTDRGRELVLEQLFASGEAYNLTLTLARKHGLLAALD